VAFTSACVRRSRTPERRQGVPTMRQTQAVAAVTAGHLCSAPRMVLCPEVTTSVTGARACNQCALRDTSPVGLGIAPHASSSDAPCPPSGSWGQPSCCHAPSRTGGTASNGFIAARAPAMAISFLSRVDGTSRPPRRACRVGVPAARPKLRQRACV